MNRKFWQIFRTTFWNLVHESEDLVGNVSLLNILLRGVFEVTA